MFSKYSILNWLNSVHKMAQPYADCVYIYAKNVHTHICTYITSVSIFDIHKKHIKAGNTPQFCSLINENKILLKFWCLKLRGLIVSWINLFTHTCKDTTHIMIFASTCMWTGLWLQHCNSLYVWRFWYFMKYTWDVFQLKAVFATFTQAYPVFSCQDTLRLAYYDTGIT